MKRVAIIGTAGRKEDGPKMNRVLFDRMVMFASEIIQSKFKLKDTSITIVSGGAAGADHVAVHYWLNEKQKQRDGNEKEKVDCQLELFFPCDITRTDTVSVRRIDVQSNVDIISFGNDSGDQLKAGRHETTTNINKQNEKELCCVDNGDWDWKTNPGRLANQLHVQFQKQTQIPSFVDFHKALEKGAVFHTDHKGFHQRNNFIAKCDYMIAFTWGNHVMLPKDGGTKYTWDRCKGQKVHVPLAWLQDPQTHMKSVFPTNARSSPLWEQFQKTFACATDKVTKPLEWIENKTNKKRKHSEEQEKEEIKSKPSVASTPARVVNLTTESYDIRIDRKTKWGNPFVLRNKYDPEERKQCVQQYRDWVRNQDNLMKDLYELKGKRLGCWCAPLLCHGEVLAELANQLDSDVATT